ncbi:MAG: 23S rRNA (guanosine(2251)-2'-O)-methyltransferase RlmB [Candidatus Delongbacteria bacterium]|jgi:23S rRNA (guanosine2251-2'-O)-methyltransferase|nr:23S rRNA (guanosine(2251)-2'-O)-methyltransferase RlmB [Candidatus Delongbacteria bacterium]
MSEIIHGNNPVIELLENDSSKIEKVLIVKTSKSDKINKVIELCKAKGIRFDLLPAEKVNSYLERNEHTNVLAMISDFKYKNLQEVIFSDNSKVVVLDNIEDPHNFGAIIRSIAGSGAEAVIIPDRNAAQVTDTVVKVSAGTIYKINVIRVKNIAQTLDKLKDMGFWIVGTDMDGDKDFREFDYSAKSAIVIGNEGKGMRRLVREKCDDLVRIDLKNNVESLNASVAAALVLFEATKK